MGGIFLLKKRLPIGLFLRGFKDVMNNTGLNLT
jgi:hypothetical protein